MKSDDFNKIVIRGAKTNNLKSVDIDLPKNNIITITGVSGSGKSTLAFDTIYKEWQFRYIESLSSYLRQFFNLWERPELDYCQWFSPAIAIEQNKKIWNSRSTIWTMTEVDDYLRLLFAKLWDIYCYNCGKKIQAQTTDNILQKIYEKFEDKKVYLVQDLWKVESQSDLLKFVRKNRKKVDAGKWYIRFLTSIKQKDDPESNEKLNIEYFYLEDPNIPIENFPVNIYWIYDRFVINDKNKSRAKDAIVRILLEGKKLWVFSVDFESKSQNEDDEKKQNLQARSNNYWQLEWFTDKNFCPDCNIVYPEFTTQHFSPNRQEWACQCCHWLWQKLQVDLEKIIDTDSKYLESILPWRDSSMGQWILEKLASKYWIDFNLQWKNLSDWFKDIIINWDGSLLRIWMWWKYLSLYYKWIEDILTQQYNKWILTVDFQAMLNLKNCPCCEGAKLKQQSLNVFISPKKGEKYNIFDLQNRTVDNLVSVLKKYMKNTTQNKDLVYRIITPLIDRVWTITDLWLHHISMSRQIWTLSGGEIQRLRLAKQLWNRLTGIIYVLDEPTIGLDNAEIKKTIKAIKNLKNMWNTIIVVEHNEEFVKNSDWIVEIWPWAWDFGGEIVFNSTYKDFIKSQTLTCQYITWQKSVKVNFGHKPSKKSVQIKKARKNNLQNIDIKFDLGSFTVITWPSWAGKTTLMYDIFYRFLNEKEKFVQSYIRLDLLKRWYSWTDIISKPIIQPDEYKNLENLALQKFFDEIEVDTIRWVENISNMVYVDQASIWKTPRSCPATFIWVFDDIRKIFAWTLDAKMLGFQEGHFSFNSKKWACTECDGYWHKKIQLQFLPDTYVPCQLCNWRRYKSEILTIKWNWKSIADILNMYVKDALLFFQDLSFVEKKLQLMVDIWLWYLKMGQPAHTMSGWESQRLKLIKHLLKSYKWHTVYFLDEPTVWLHPQDIEKLLNVMERFLDNWDSIFMIEHDKNLLKFADNVIELQNWQII